MHRDAMKTVLISGMMGSGKSEVARYLSSKGCPVYDCDSRAKALYDDVPGLTERIEEALGCTSLRREDGILDRRKLARIIFSDPAKRAALEAILYPVLLEDFKAWRDSKGEGPVFMESAVAASRPEFRRECDAVLEIRAGEQVRLGRVLKRDSGMRRADALARMKAQESGTPAAEFVIENDGDLESLHDKVNVFLKKI